MIRNGQATLVTSAAEVLELVSGMGQHLVTPVQTPRRATDALSDNQLAVFEATPARRRISFGDIALAAGVPVPTCLAALHELEAVGLVEGSEQGWRALPVQALTSAPT
jgi:DNA processing protein